MRATIPLFLLFVLSSCGSSKPHRTERPAPQMNLVEPDELINTSWELVEEEGVLGFYFGKDNTFARIAYKTSPSVQAMGIKGYYKISDDGELVTFAEEKTCDSFSGRSRQVSDITIVNDSLYFGPVASNFPFAKTEKSFTEKYGDQVEWGCLDNDGKFTRGPWRDW